MIYIIIRSVRAALSDVVDEATATYLKTEVIICMYVCIYIYDIYYN